MSGEADFLVRLRDGATMIADAAQERLEKLGPKGAREDVTPDLSSVIWKATTGAKGPFEIAEATSNAKNQAFEGLKSYLAAHSGRAQICGFFVWTFADTSGSVGRKIVQKQT